MADRAHKPSEVNTQSQKAAPMTHEKNFGGVSSHVDGDAFNNMPGVNLPDPTNSPGRMSSGDGFGKMMRGMGSSREDMTTPATPPTQSRRKSGTP